MKTLVNDEPTAIETVELEVEKIPAKIESKQTSTKTIIILTIVVIVLIGIWMYIKIKNKDGNTGN